MGCLLRLRPTRSPNITSIGTLKWSKRNSAGLAVERVNEEKGPTKSEAFKSFQQDKTRGHFRSDILTVPHPDAGQAGGRLWVHRREEATAISS
jgi:hypothetical protein